MNDSPTPNSPTPNQDTQDNDTPTEPLPQAEAAVADPPAPSGDVGTDQVTISKQAAQRTGAVAAIVVVGVLGFYIGRQESVNDASMAAFQDGRGGQAQEQAQGGPHGGPHGGQYGGQYGGPQGEGQGEQDGRGGRHGQEDWNPRGEQP